MGVIFVVYGYFHFTWFRCYGATLNCQTTHTEWTPAERNSSLARKCSSEQINTWDCIDRYGSSRMLSDLASLNTWTFPDPQIFFLNFDLHAPHFDYDADKHRACTSRLGAGLCLWFPGFTQGYEIHVFIWHDVFMMPDKYDVSKAFLWAFETTYLRCTRHINIFKFVPLTWIVTPYLNDEGDNGQRLVMGHGRRCAGV